MPAATPRVHVLVHWLLPLYRRRVVCSFLSFRLADMLVTFAELYLSDFHWGVRVSTGYDWPNDYSGHGGCQIGKRRIVVHKYTGLARKWSWGVVRGVRVDPQRGSAELSGGSATSCVGVKPPDPPSNTALYICMHRKGKSFPTRFAALISVTACTLRDSIQGLLRPHRGRMARLSSSQC